MNDIIIHEDGYSDVNQSYTREDIMPDLTRLSRFLSYVLRHKPDSIGIELTWDGWANIEQLVTNSQNQGYDITVDIVNQIVAEDEKGRYVISPDKLQIRATQGHSVDVDLNFEEKVPPVVLWHGTYADAVPTIMKQGLKKMKRHHVHLSSTTETAKKVGSRRGASVLLMINTKDMVKNGIKFFLSENGVWLTEYVEPKYIEII